MINNFSAAQPQWIKKENRLIAKIPNLHYHHNVINILFGQMFSRKIRKKFGINYNLTIFSSIIVEYEHFQCPVCGKTVIQDLDSGSVV